MFIQIGQGIRYKKESIQGTDDRSWCVGCIWRPTRYPPKLVEGCWREFHAESNYPRNHLLPCAFTNEIWSSVSGLIVCSCTCCKWALFLFVPVIVHHDQESPTSLGYLRNEKILFLLYNQLWMYLRFLFVDDHIPKLVLLPDYFSHARFGFCTNT